MHLDFGSKILPGALVSTYAIFICICLPTSRVNAQVSYETAPISYLKSKPTDRVARLDAELKEGKVELEFDRTHGWLPSLLKALDIDPESQLLVFSKTSLQLRKISPRRPRALYFNDEVYVGFCQKGDFLEIAATDKDLGATFYTLDQENEVEPVIKRDRGQCLSCHATHRTQGVPGLLVRSIFSDFNGRPRTGTRTYITDHTTEFEKRYGGWYVLGQHGDMRHMGNVISKDRLDPEAINRDTGANLESLGELCDTTPYLNGSSDLVALLLLEHQTQMHNYIARASMETRIARHYDEGINEALGRKPGTMSDSTKRRIASAGEKLVRYLLFADERALPSPILGLSKFTQIFQSDKHPSIRRDSKGRSLRDLDLDSRLLKYPCSYLIYTEAFDALPPAMAEYVQSRLKEVLLAEDTIEGYERLTLEMKKAIVEILDETKPGYLES